MPRFASRPRSAVNVTTPQHSQDDPVKLDGSFLSVLGALGYRAVRMTKRRSDFTAPCLVLLLVACDTSAGRIDEACRSNTDCASTELCATGLCEGGIGVCIERPVMCDDVNNPVCGCDGKTYQSDCLADMAGVRLATNQPCVCQNNGECVQSQFCALDDSCGNPGTCSPKPESCDPADVQEVCGCDAVTYSNACTAFQSGARVSALGMCDCTTNEDCAANQYCNAIACDGPGGCEDRPMSCPSEGPEVTGCDGVIYESSCVAAMQGVRSRPDN